MKTYTLHPYQRELLRAAWIAMFKQNHRSVLIQLETGGGKTIIGSEFIDAVIRLFDWWAMFFAHRREIIHQTADKLAKADLHPGIIMRGDLYQPNRRVQVASIQSYLSWVNRGKIAAHKPDLIVQDEAHSNLGKSTRAVLEAALSDGCKLLGLSATPVNKRGYGLADLYEVMVKGPPTQALIDMGFLVPVDYYMGIQPDVSGLKINDGDYTEADLDRVMNHEALVGDIVDNWHRHSAGRPTIAFGASVAHSMYLAQQFRNAGLRAIHIDGTTDKRKVRDPANKDLAEGRLDVLCNYGTHVEGTDIPPVACIVDACPTASLMRYKQKGGRGMRTSVETGKVNCLARGTLILTDAGEIPIECVTLDHKLWDGESFVRHGGALCKGFQSTMFYDGIDATHDHKVMTDDGWKRLADAAREQRRIVVSGVNGAPVRVAANYIEGGSRFILESACKGALRMWCRALDVIEQPVKAWWSRRLSVLQGERTHYRSTLALSPLQWTAAALPESKQSMLSALRRAWDSIQLFIHQFGSALGGREPWLAIQPVDATGPHQQRRSLRARQPAMGDGSGKCKQSKGYPARKARADHCFSRQSPGDKVRRFNPVSVNGCINRRANNRAVPPTILQTQREVWDILDCGPLQRFTANGRLVHNCNYHDHSGNVLRHGRLEMFRDWALTKGRENIEANERAMQGQVIERTCPTCGYLFKGAVCLNCHEPYVPQGVEMEIVPAVLAKMTYAELDAYVAKKHKVKQAEEAAVGMQKFYLEARGWCETHGKKDGFAYHAFKDKYKIEPRKEWQAMDPVMFTGQTDSYMRSRLIKAAKGFAKKRLANG